MSMFSPHSPSIRRQAGRIVTVCIGALALWTPALGQRGEQKAEEMEFSVHVTDFQYETPLDQVRIDLVRPPDEIVETRFTDSKGDVTFRVIHPGGYVIRTYKDGYTGAEVQVSFRRNQNIGQIPLQLKRASTETHERTVSQSVSARSLAIPSSAQQEFQAGIALLNDKKDPKGGLEHFQKAIAAYPEYYEAYFLAGMANIQLKRPDAARAALAEAIKLNPKFLEPYYPLATLLMSAKEYAEGERLLLQAQALDPNGWQWPFELARSKANEKQWDQALSYAQSALKKLNPPAKVHVLLADIYEDTGNPARAIEELEQFQKLDPNSPLMPRVRAALTQLKSGVLQK